MASEGYKISFSNNWMSIDYSGGSTSCFFSKKRLIQFQKSLIDFNETFVEGRALNSKHFESRETFLWEKTQGWELSCVAGNSIVLLLLIDSYTRVNIAINASDLVELIGQITIALDTFERKF